jgi:Leucine-rich repeat (LRR) protein
MNKSSKKRKGRNDLVILGENKRFAINPDDYRSLEDLLTKSGMWGDVQVQEIIDIQKNDQEKRVWKLRIIEERTKHRITTAAMEQMQNFPDLTHLQIQQRNKQPLLAAIGKAKNLKHLDTNGSEISSLPSSIGELQNLKELRLDYTRDLSGLPEEIGNLTNLIKLNLNGSSISSIPRSIGKLRNLKELLLDYTDNLSGLPEEIGNLTNLIELNLNGSSISSIPRSIGKLRNLKELLLDYTDNLSGLPEEIGNLTNLIELNLDGSSISSIPRSIGKLRNLKELHLDYTDNLSGLPEEIGDLTSLVDYQWSDRYGSKKPFSNRILYRLACGRARWRTGFGIAQRVRMPPKLFPLILNSAMRAFRGYPSEKYGYQYPDFAMDPPDAIHHLLVFGREELVGILYNRQNIM